MVKIGFALQHLRASKDHFSPVTMDVDRSIHFHEPHPGRKVPYNIARDFGRRLNRAYGWDGQMFTLAAKGARLGWLVQKVASRKLLHARWVDWEVPVLPANTFWH